MSLYRLIADPLAEGDIQASVDWYERAHPGLGRVFIDEIREVFQRILDGPLKYAELRSGVRRATSQRFPYSVYFVIDADAIVVLAVMHTSRDPASWQKRIRQIPGSKVVEKLAGFDGGDGDGAVGFDLVDAGEAHAGGQLSFGEVAAVAGEDGRGIGPENDAALAAFEMAAAVVVKVEAVGVEDLEEQRAGGRGDFAKVLDPDTAFP